MAVAAMSRLRTAKSRSPFGERLVPAGAYYAVKQAGGQLPWFSGTETTAESIVELPQLSVTWYVIV